MKKVIFIGFCLLAQVCMGQDNNPPQAIIVPGRVLSAPDSMLVKELFLSGLQAKTVQNFQLAADFFDRVLKTDPANDAALYELANIRHAENKEQEAEALIRKAVTVKPENEWYWILLADIYKQTGNMQALVPVFDELIKLSPQKEDYYFDKANALFLQQKTADADKVYDTIEKNFGLSDDLVNARKRIHQKAGGQKAINELEKQVKENPQDIAGYLELSEQYIKARQSDKAVKLLTTAKKENPDNPYIRLSLADAYRVQNKTADAFIELKAAFNSTDMDIDSKVRIVLSFFPDFKITEVRAEAEELSYIITQVHPQDAKGFALYGDVLFQQQKYPEAIAAYKQALALNKRVYMVWEQLIRLEMGQRSFSDVIADGEEALSLFPNQPVLYFYTAVGYSQEKNYEKAISYLNNALDLQPDNKALLSQIYSTLGDSYNALKKFAESDQAYDKALETDGENTYALNNYAYYLSLRNEKLDKAEQMSLKSNRLEKDNASFEDTYAWILFKQQKYEQARIWMEKAISHDRQNSAIQAEHYGDILYKLGETELAVKQWLQAQKYGEKSELLQRKINEKKYFE
ncbi:tetratricopeptide repeat protein [Pedobacter sp. BS3]|uniref:tetratricopeptide repeat protein n=1 Tax=Pedobacter sp. BS3 TaxID=2567937 RepID=UPI0011ECB5DE|nr:tetratricopeptide repeat protein [Pedobacter sp. BS3]TZF83197.1 tetratricopeptide repeat protein [Pedobacter sp. BS3]